jgi:hypothetical protein
MLDLVADALNVKYRVLVRVARELSQEFLGLQGNSELLVQNMQKDEIDLKTSRGRHMIRVASLSFVQCNGQ